MFSEAQETQPDTLQSWEAPSAQQQVPGHSSRSRLAPALNDSSHRTAASQTCHISWHAVNLACCQAAHACRPVKSCCQQLHAALGTLQSAWLRP